MKNSHILISWCSCLDYVSSSKLKLQTFVFGRSPPHSFSTSVYLRDNTAANPLQGQYLYWMISPHCLFILPADVISSCCRWTLNCHLPPVVGGRCSWERPRLYLCRIPPLAGRLLKYLNAKCICAQRSLFIWIPNIIFHPVLSFFTFHWL